MFKKLYSAMYLDDCYPFHVLTESVEAVSDPDELTEPNSALIIWGGADINPSLYKHPMHQTTRPGGMRDRIEWGLVQTAIERGIPIIGVCRGAQMLCAAAGGFLIQDVDNHAGARHAVKTFDGQSFMVNSIHHQMMAGYEKVDHELVAWSAKLSPQYHYRDNKLYDPPEGWKEPEMIYFKKIMGVAIQWHPEMMDDKSEATIYILNYLKGKIANEWSVQCHC